MARWWRRSISVLPTAGKGAVEVARYRGVAFGGLLTTLWIDSSGSFQGLDGGYGRLAMVDLVNNVLVCSIYHPPWLMCEVICQRWEARANLWAAFISPSVPCSQRLLCAMCTSAHLLRLMLRQSWTTSPKALPQCSANHRSSLKRRPSCTSRLRMARPPVIEKLSCKLAFFHRLSSLQAGSFLVVLSWMAGLRISTLS